ncbi:anaerobic C4-dicarboxylate transporter family protein [Escherichia coli]
MAGRYFRFQQHRLNKDAGGEVIQGHPSLWPSSSSSLSALLYSQAATAKALMPMALALYVSPLTALLFSLPCLVCSFCRPTRALVAAIQMDDTGTTRYLIRLQPSVLHPGYSGCCPGRLLRLRAG